MTKSRLNLTKVVHLVVLLVIRASSGENGGVVCASLSISNTNECVATSSTLFDGGRTLEYILADDFDTLDPSVLSKSLNVLKQRGAHRCWHKHSTFLDHLLGVHNILRLWGQGSVIGRVGLFHSAYSNSYVNLALFDPETERTNMQELIGEEAEKLVYLFCIIDRQEVVVNTLLKQGYIPRDGLFVPHLRNPNEKIFLSAETLRMLIVFTMADTSDQYFGWQDQLFGGGGENGSMIIPGQDFVERHDSKAIWPGISKPGLWMSYISDLGKVARTFDPSWRQEMESDSDQILDVPPIFHNCTKTISVEDERIARDLYWDAITSDDIDDKEMIAKLEKCHELNPWAFEPLVILAQKYLHRNEYDLAQQVTERALQLQHEWGTPWDKRLAFGAWVAWTRVMHQKAIERKPWSANSWDVNNLGLVR